MIQRPQINHLAVELAMVAVGFTCVGAAILLDG
jgi:hypothetical protein